MAYLLHERIVVLRNRSAVVVPWFIAARLREEMRAPWDLLYWTTGRAYLRKSARPAGRRKASMRHILRSIPRALRYVDNNNPRKVIPAWHNSW